MPAGRALPVQEQVSVPLPEQVSVPPVSVQPESVPPESVQVVLRQLVSPPAGPVLGPVEPGSAVPVDQVEHPSGRRIAA